MGHIPHPRDELDPNPGEPTTEDLHAEHCQYVRSILGSYGIDGQDSDDVAQMVWMRVHRRRDSYSPTKHETRRAWLTGFVARCAANHRRARRTELRAFEGDAGELPAAGLDPEQCALVRDLHRLIPDEERRGALLLQLVHGLSVAEIAAAQGVTEAVAERR